MKTPNNKPNGSIVLDKGDPWAIATVVLREYFIRDDLLCLQHSLCNFYYRRCQNNGTAWERLDPASVRSLVWMLLATAKRKVEGEIVPFRPGMQDVTSVIDALEAQVHLPNSIKLANASSHRCNIEQLVAWLRGDEREKEG